MGTAVWTIEPPRAAELAEITRLVVESEVEELGDSDSTELDVSAIWSWPRFDLGADAWVARASDGTLLGYAWVHGPLGPQRYAISKLVPRPGSSREVAEALLARIETRAAELTQGEGPAPLLSVPCAATNQAKRELLARRGYSVVRVFYRMQRDLAGSIPEPRWPDGMTLTAVRRPDDERDLHETLQDAFSEHFHFIPETLEEWAIRSLERSDFVPEISYVLREEGRAVAAVINYLSDDMGWVSDLGVRKAWRRRGIATAMLLQSFRDFQERGMRLAGLDVDSENDTRAVSVYEAVGLRVTQRRELFEREIGRSPG